MDPKKLEKAFDLMVIGFAEAGLDALTIGKLVISNKKALGLPSEEEKKLRDKAEFAILAKDTLHGSNVDGGEEPRAAGRGPNLLSSPKPGKPVREHLSGAKTS